MPSATLETVAAGRSETLGGFRPPAWIPYPLPRLPPPPPPPPSQVSGLLSNIFPQLAKSPRLPSEVESMISKGALERVQDPGPGFYSHLFLVEKALGGWRPVIDLSPLNEFVRQTPFKMETASSVLLSVREGDFLAST